MSLTLLDVLVIGGYLGAMALMGVYFSRRNKDTERYFVGGRTFSGWVIGLSLVGTSISSVTFLAYPADAYKTSWLRFLPNLALPVCALVGAFVFLPIYRRLRIVSVYEYLEQRFGPSIRIYGALTYIAGQFVRVSAVLYLVALLMHEVTGWDPVLCIVVTGVVVSIYTIIGGIDAVIWTDVIQTIVLIIGGVLCLGLIISHIPGGVGQIISVAWTDHKLSIAELRDGQLEPARWGFSLTEKTGLMMIILGLTAYLNEFGANQTTVQRYAASRSISEARKALFVNAFLNVPIWALYMFLGTALYVFFKTFPQPEATAMLDGSQKAEQILPYFVIHYLPSGITGLVLAAALAAAMSSLDSSINAVSAVAVTDLYKRLVRKGRDDRHYLIVSWCLAAVTAVVMVGGAIVLAEMSTTTLQDTATILGSLLGAGLFGVFMLGIFTRRGDARAVGFGILGTLLFTAWTIVASRMPSLLPSVMSVPFELYYTGILGNVVMFVLGYAVGCLLPRREHASRLKGLTVWDLAQRRREEPPLYVASPSSKLSD